MKLRLAQRVLGCATQKEMQARFLQVNPQSGYDPKRAYKWVQDRAAPRDPSVYEDLGRVLDLAVPGDTVRICSFEMFRRLVEARHGPTPAIGFTADRQEAGATAFPGRLREPGAPAPRYLIGRYLALSMGWSAMRTGQLILGALTIEEDPVLGLRVIYEERLPGGDLVAEGTVRRVGRNLTVTVANDEDSMMFMSLRLPPAPAVALAGVMAGAAHHDAETRPVAGRLFCIRAAFDDREALLSLTGYCDASEAAVARTLLATGASPEVAASVAARIVSLIVAPAPEGLVDVPAAAVNDAVAMLYGAMD